MAARDRREARRAAMRNAQQAVRMFARDPSTEAEQAVAQACARRRMIEEARARDRQEARSGN